MSKHSREPRRLCRSRLAEDMNPLCTKLSWLKRIWNFLNTLLASLMVQRKRFLENAKRDIYLGKFVLLIIIFCIELYLKNY